MSKNPNLKCRFCGTEKNVRLTYPYLLEEVKSGIVINSKSPISWSIMTCHECIPKLPTLMGDSTSKLKNTIINYIKRLKMKCRKVELQ